MGFNLVDDVDVHVKWTQLREVKAWVEGGELKYLTFEKITSGAIIVKDTWWTALFPLCYEV